MFLTREKFCSTIAECFLPDTSATIVAEKNLTQILCNCFLLVQQRNTYVDCLHQCYNLTICICSKFAETIPRPFTIRYDPYTQSVEVVNSKERMLALASDIKYSISTLEDAIKSTALVPKGDVEVRPFALWLYIMHNS